MIFGIEKWRKEKGKRAEGRRGDRRQTGREVREVKGVKNGEGV